MDDQFQAVQSKLVYTAEKLHTDLPRRKNESKIFVCINYTYQVVQGPEYLKVLGPKPSVLQNLKITWVCTTLFKSLSFLIFLLCKWQCEFTWSIMWWMILSQFYSHFLFLVSHYRVVIKSIFGLLLCVDPDWHCAVMLIYDTHIVVLLFRQEGALEEHEQEGTFTARYDICA